MSLKMLVEEYTDIKYNFCLVNFYSSGKDSISYHSDDEHFLGPLPTYHPLPPSPRLYPYIL
jgi:alkylated DNA repair dioxygenase AlkB